MIPGGWQWPNAGRRGGREDATEKRGRKGEREGGEDSKEKGGRKKGRKGERKEKRETKGEGRRKGREEERKGERALLASAVHVARAPYMNVTQDVAVGLSCILYTPTFVYPEYDARLRSIIRNTMHASDRFARFFMKIANKFAYSKNSLYLCSRICVRALLRARTFSNVLL